MGLFQPDLLGLVERDARLGTRILLPLARITGQRLIRADGEILRQHETLARYAADLHAADVVAAKPPRPPALAASAPPPADPAQQNLPPLDDLHADSNSDGHTAEAVPPGARAVD
jgi:hypothetical protein